MSTYQAIIRQFRKQGLSEEQEITEHELKKALDNICSKNAGIAQFDHEVAHQIWNQTRDNQVGGPVKLKDFVNTMVKAQNILKQQVEYTQNLLRSQNDSRKKQQLLNDLFSYSQDHRSITMPFGLQQIRQSKQIQQSRMNNTIKPAKSFYFSTSVDEREQSTDLKIVFFLTLALLLLDLIVMFEKNNIYNLLGISFILCCYVLNYFEQIYVRFILIWTSVAILLDLVWLIVKTDSFWSPSQNNLHSNQQIGLLRFIIVMVCFQMIIKMVLLALLFKYRAVGETLRKKIDIFGLITFLLDGSPDSHNLISNIFVDKNPPSSSFYQPV